MTDEINLYIDKEKNIKTNVWKRLFAGLIYGFLIMKKNNINEKISDSEEKIRGGSYNKELYF